MSVCVRSDANTLPLAAEELKLDKCVCSDANTLPLAAEELKLDKCVCSDANTLPLAAEERKLDKCVRSDANTLPLAAEERKLDKEQVNDADSAQKSPSGSGCERRRVGSLELRLRPMTLGECYDAALCLQTQLWRDIDLSKLQYELTQGVRENGVFVAVSVSPGDDVANNDKFETTKPEILAVALCWGDPNFKPMGRYVRRLCVKRGYTRQGIGETLLGYVEQQTKPFAGAIWLATGQDNVGAQRFYEKMGYTIVGKVCRAEQDAPAPAPVHSRNVRADSAPSTHPNVHLIYRKLLGPAADDTVSTASSLLPEQLDSLGSTASFPAHFGSRRSNTRMLPTRLLRPLVVCAFGLGLVYLGREWMRRRCN